MDKDDNLPRRADDPLRLLVQQDLDPQSIEELEQRIATLDEEIKRTQEKIRYRVNHKASAEALFKK